MELGLIAKYIDLDLKLDIDIEYDLYMQVTLSVRRDGGNSRF